MGFAPDNDTPASTRIPACPVDPDRSFAQAGGHPGTFVPLENKYPIARVAKKYGHKVEWYNYMEMWCLKKLVLNGYGKREVKFGDTLGQAIRQHPLVHLALSPEELYRIGATSYGYEPWAPKFYGACHIKKVPYMIIENLLDKFNKPCFLDAKLGKRTVEPTASWTKALRLKVLDATTMAKGGNFRVTGFRTWDPVSQTEQKFAFADKFGYRRKQIRNFIQQASSSVFNQITDKLSHIWRFWSATGQHAIRSVGLSALMIYECSGGEEPPDPEVKVIDFAHMYNSQRVAETWPLLDGVAEGIHELKDYIEENNPDQRPSTQQSSTEQSEGPFITTERDLSRDGVRLDTSGSEGPLVSMEAFLRRDDGRLETLGNEDREAD